MMRFKVVTSGLLVLVTLFSTVVFSGYHPVSADGPGANDDTGVFSPQLAAQLTKIFQQKESRTPAQRKIDSHLLDFEQKAEERVSAMITHGEPPDLSGLSTSMVHADSSGNVKVKMTVTGLTDGQRQQLESLGMNIVSVYPEYGVVEGSLPYSQLEAAAGLGFVKNISPPGYAIFNTGNVTSAGDTVLRADLARSTFGVYGSGIKVGVMSDGANHWQNSVDSGNLPADVDVLKVGSGDEGTAMMEIIHDLAPGASLAFYGLRNSTSTEMVTAINDLAAAGCEVIVDDITFLDEPKFEDGPIAQAARNFVDSGGVYVTSAGNSAQTHYYHQYIPVSINSSYPYAHDYGGGDIGNAFTVPANGSIIVILQWNDKWGQAGDDFDLALVDSDNVVLRLSDNLQNGSGNPWEAIDWTNGPDSKTVNIVILQDNLVNPPSSIWLDYNVYNDFGAALQYNTPESSVIGHQAVEEVMSTAAVRASSENTVEYFSSRGPGIIYFPSQETRQVPNITGVDGVSTATGQSGYFYEPFYGTSAAAPHIAAIAALVWSADPSLTSAEVRNAITSTADDIASPGFDYMAGYGRADAYDAVESVFSLSVVTDPATGITPTSANLNGTLTMQGYTSANVSFEWGNASDNLSGETSPEPKGASGNFSAPVSGLQPSTIYFFRAKAATGNVTRYGETANFTTEKALASIEVAPAGPTVVLGRNQPFTATGNYTDNSHEDLTMQVNWASSDNTIARINGAGLATGYAVGSANITATLGEVSGNTTLTVGPKELDHVYVEPVAPVVFLDSGNSRSRQFTAVAGYSDGTTDNVTGLATWASDNTSVATVNATTGLAEIKSAGASLISASYNGTSGNTTLTVRADTSAPVVRITSPVDGQVLSATSVNVTGTVDDASANATIVLNGVSVNATLAGDGSFNHGISLNTGENTIQVTAVDAAGNQGQSGTVVVTVNTTRPGVTIVSPVTGGVTKNQTLPVTGNVTSTASGNVTSATLVLNGVSQSINVNSGSFSSNVTLAQGVNVITVYAYAAGHSGESAYMGTSGARRVTLDTTPPNVVIISPLPGQLVSNPGCTVSGTVDDPGVTGVNMTLNGVSQMLPVVNGVFNHRVTLTSVNNTLRVTATDPAGNTSTPVTVTVTRDNGVPEINITSPENNLATNQAVQTITGTINDASIDSATLYLNGAARSIAVAPTGEQGHFSENVTLASGNNTIEVRASGGSSGNLTAELDTTDPQISIDLGEPAGSVEITVASNEALATEPSVSVNTTQAAANVTMAPSGVKQWRGTWDIAADGVYTVSVNATDRAGNTTIRTAEFSRQTITVTANGTDITFDTVMVRFTTTANVTGQVSVTWHIEDPSGNTGTPDGADKEAGVYLEIVVAPELRESLGEVYIEAGYDQGALPADTDESTLRLYLWDVATGGWQAVANGGVDTNAHYVYGTVTHLSAYGVFGRAQVHNQTRPPSGGGGGGGGGALTGNRSRTNLSSITNSSLKLNADAEATSADFKLSLFIARATKVMNKLGNMLTSILIQTLDEPPAAPEYKEIVGKAYDIGPNGATFDPPASLTIKYEPDDIPAGVVGDKLYIAAWNSENQTWERLQSVVNQEKGTVSTSTGHLSIYAIMADVHPASFEASGLSIVPAEVSPGESIGIRVLVTNTGDFAGTYQASLNVDNVLAQIKDISLDGGGSETVEFTVTSDTPGEHLVNVGGLSGSFVVSAPETTTTTSPAPAALPPASFTLSDLSVTPGEVRPSETVTVSTAISNVGGSEGSYLAILKVNGTEEATRQVTIGAGGSETVTFAVVKDILGNYTVSIGDRSGEFVVNAPPPPTTPTTEAPVTARFGWGLFAIIGGALVVLILLILYLLIFRR